MLENKKDKEKATIFVVLTKENPTKKCDTETEISLKMKTIPHFQKMSLQNGLMCVNIRKVISPKP